MSIEICDLKRTDIASAVDMHMRSFPTFFLTFLGPRFLTEFYCSFLVDEEGVGLVAREKKTKRIVGVVVGPVSPHGYFKRLLRRRWWSFCLASVVAVVKNPGILVRLVRSVYYRGAAPEGSNRSLLSSLAVSPEVQGQGVGRLLVSRWIEEIKSRGSTGCYLSTDACNNDGVNAFYEKLGWERELIYVTPEGRKMNRYVRDFC